MGLPKLQEKAQRLEKQGNFDVDYLNLNKNKSSYSDNEKFLIIKGARQNNLKNIDIELPKYQFIVITGVSGSGKSSLAFDTIYAEGQRRYIMSMSAYARQFLKQLDKPDVDRIEALSPAISIEQKTSSHNPRSTVGTVTEIYYFLRLLFARIGVPHCFKCGREINTMTIQQMVDKVLDLKIGTRILVLSPKVEEKKGAHKRILRQIKEEGFQRVRIDGEIKSLDDENIDLNSKLMHNIEIIVDRLAINTNIRERLTDSIETAINQSNGKIIVTIVKGKTSKDLFFSEQPLCPKCNIAISKIEPRLFSFNSPYGACPKCKGLGDGCRICNDARLRPEALAVRIGGKNIAELSQYSITRVLQFFEDLQLTKQEKFIGKEPIQAIKSRLGFLQAVGLDYLTLARAANTLSGGEAQRVRLATQIGSKLRGVIFILDEPSIGLHYRDKYRLLDTLKILRDRKNTIIVVEHDEDTIRAADWIVDLGPGGGNFGGEIITVGSLKDIINCPESITGQYLSGKRFIALPDNRREPNKHHLTIKGAAQHNLKEIDVTIPLGLFICVTGVSGSGKSTLVNNILHKALAQKLHRAKRKVGKYKEITGVEYLDKVIIIDQSPIGRTPRSNPGTYTKAFDHIRELYAQMPLSRRRGYKRGRFSFNVKGGRCEKCRGGGQVKIEMYFFADVFIKCNHCKGKRYNRETLEVLYKGKNIYDILEMTVEEALVFFKYIPKLNRILQTLYDVGLGYIKIGQPSPSLSGGEAQRIKLSKELSRPDTGKTLYILDEPTTGLHFADVQFLLNVLQRLVDQGNTVIIIEHNLDIIKMADHIIDLGPEGGEAGGTIIAEGTPEKVACVAHSYTGHAIADFFRQEHFKQP